MSLLQPAPGVLKGDKIVGFEFGLELFGNLRADTFAPPLRSASGVFVPNGLKAAVADIPDEFEDFGA